MAWAPSRLRLCEISSFPHAPVPLCPSSPDRVRLAMPAFREVLAPAGRRACRFVGHQPGFGFAFRRRLRPPDPGSGLGGRCRRGRRARARTFGGGPCGGRSATMVDELIVHVVDDVLAGRLCPAGDRGRTRLGSSFKGTGTDDFGPDSQFAQKAGDLAGFQQHSDRAGEGRRRGRRCGWRGRRSCSRRRQRGHPW